MFSTILYFTYSNPINKPAYIQNYVKFQGIQEHDWFAFHTGITMSYMLSLSDISNYNSSVH